ncbi:MAG: hypothetical protein KDK37_05875 [Leptospiraceae bacterium]|nr:hypothetical protein [Leptospiraceae bacterium]
MQNDIKQQLHNALVEEEFPKLLGLGIDRAYDALSKICMSEGKPITVDQMLKYAVVIESDLQHDSLL